MYDYSEPQEQYKCFSVSMLHIILEPDRIYDKCKIHLKILLLYTLPT